MKRSEINQIIRETKEFFAAYQFLLPPFAQWTPGQWAAQGKEVNEIRQNFLGWDLTDFGDGDFAAMGLTLFTVRNGNLADPGDKKSYAEKIMVVRENQVTPMHFHWKKVEDIINRGGGNLIVELWNSTKEEQLDHEKPVKVATDGVVRTLEPGAQLRLTPGESVTLTQGLYHKFWGEEGKGWVLVGEVSSVNDDSSDNCFLEPLGRFPEIEEDESPETLLCSEYPAAV